MRPGEVLDARNDFVARLAERPRFCSVLDNFGDTEYGRTGGYRKTRTTPVHTLIGNLLKVAECYRVTHDMSVLVQHAASGLDDLDRFDPRLAPTQCGFVALDRPLPLVDMRGRTMLIHYMMWAPVSVQDTYTDRPVSTPARAYYCFNDVWRQPDEVQDALVEEMDEDAVSILNDVMGRWATVGAGVFFDQMRLGPPTLATSEEIQAQLISEGSTPTEGTNVVRYVHALWLLMNQTVARVEDEQADRPARRRSGKARLPSKVTVVRLRREQGSERRDGESLVEWSHRWVVRGHWRWQPVGERHPQAQEIAPGRYAYRIWINPYVKGPEDAPLVQSEKVYSLER